MAFLAALPELIGAGEAAGGAAAAEGAGAGAAEAKGGSSLLDNLGKGNMPSGGGHGESHRSDSGESRVGSFSAGQEDAAMANAAQRETNG